MKNLAQYIESLLIQHECVIAPGLGGFVTYRDKASIRNNRLYAPAQRVRFNHLLTYHDGLLAEAYMQDRHIGYTAALEAIKADVEQITTALNSGNTFILGRIGALSLSADNTIILKNEDCKFLLENIGLPVVNLKQLANESNNDNTIKLNIPRASSNALRYVASIAIIFIITLFIPNTNNNIQRASLAFDSISDISIIDYRLQFTNNNIQTINDTIKVTKYDPNESDIHIAKIENETFDSEEIDEIEQEEIATHSEIVVTEEIEEVEKDEKEDEIVEKTTTPTPYKTSANINETKKTHTKSDNSTKNKYYLIIASFTSIEDAEKYINRHTHFEQSQLEIIESNGKYRVSAVSFTKYKEAIQYVDSVRANVPAAKKAWIMCK